MIQPSEIGEIRPLIYDLDLPALEEALARWGEPPYRALQIWQGLYRKLWDSPEKFTNLPRSLRLLLDDNFSFSALQPTTVLESSDGGTRKTLFSLSDHLAIEAVLMRYSKRRTLCISSQAGCAMGCVFCATGQMGYRRNLTSGEIVEQVIYYARQLAQAGEQVTNIVVMGMGEPFHNYDETLAAIERLNHPEGLNLGARRFTISTVGLIPAIKRFTSEKRQVNLAISLHAADDELRASMLPIDRKYPLNDLLAACQAYVETTGRRITFEWALIREVNDTPEQAARLVERLQPFIRNGAALCHVNVIPLNPTRNYRGKATTRERAEAFKAILEAAGIPCTIRMRRGIDIQAGCGQLATAARADADGIFRLAHSDPDAASKNRARPGKPAVRAAGASRPAPARPAPARPQPSKPAPAPTGRAGPQPAAPAPNRSQPARPGPSRPAPSNRPKPGGGAKKPAPARSRGSTPATTARPAGPREPRKS